MPSRFFPRFALLVPFAVVLSTACGNDPTPDGTLSSIEVTPDPNALAAGDAQTFVATGRDASGNEVEVSPAVTWSVVAGGGTVNASTGRFTAGTLAGFFENTVRATNGTISGFASVSVTEGDLSAVVVSPDPATVGTTAPIHFTAEGRDTDDNVVLIPGPMVWSVVTAAAGTIDAESGEFQASGTVGTYADAVRATSNGTTFGTATVVVASAGPLATITVTPSSDTVGAGASRKFRAAGEDVNGVAVNIPGLVWSVEHGGGTVNASTGLFVAGSSLGNFSNTVRATSGSISGSASLTVAASSSTGPSLHTADPFAVLGSTAISCVGVSTIYGNVGVAPAGSVSGFPAPCTIASPGDPVPHVNDATALDAQADVTPAYNALAAMACGTELTGQDLGGMTLAPGVYCFTSSAQLTGDLTLAGPANGLWVFQVATALTTGTSAHVLLSGGAKAKNVFWQVGSSATLGQTTVFRGNIVAAVSVTMVQGSSLIGRALSKAGVTMDGSTVTLP